MKNTATQIKSTMHFKESALACYENGWEPIPILPGEKRPNIKEWNKLDVDREIVTGWVKSRGSSSVGLRTGNSLIAIDVDVYRGDTPESKQRTKEFSQRIQVCLVKVFGDDILIRRNGTDDGRFLVPLRCSDVLKKSVLEFSRADYPDELHKIEILGLTSTGKANQFVAFGYRTEDGGENDWDNGRSPANTNIDDLYECSHEELIAGFSLFKRSWADLTGTSIISEAEKFKKSVIDEYCHTDFSQSNVVPLHPVESGSCDDIAIEEFQRITRFVLRPKSEEGLGYANADRDTFLSVLRAYQDRDSTAEGLDWFISNSKTAKYPDESNDITRDWNTHTRTDFDGDKVHASTILHYQKDNLQQWNRYEKSESMAALDDHQVLLEKLTDKKALMDWACVVKADSTLNDDHRLQLIPFYRSCFKRINGITATQADARAHLYPERLKKVEVKIEKSDFTLQMVDCIVEDAFLYVDDHGAAYLDYLDRLGLPVDGTEITFLIDEIALERFKRSIDDRDIKKIKRHLTRHCRQSGNVIQTVMRYARYKDRYFVDLRDTDNTIFEFSASGLRAADPSDLPIRFRKGADGIALPEPFGVPTEELINGINNTVLQRVNVKGQTNRIHFLSSIVNAMLAPGESPIFLFSGMHGSGKSTVMLQWRDMFDPQSYKLTGLPRTGRDFGRRMAADLVTCIDNVKGVSGGIEDFLCRVAEGSPDAATKLYAEQGEVKTDLTGTLAFTSTATKIFKQPDLNSRTIVIPITAVDGVTLTKNQIFEQTRQAQPEIFSLLISLAIEVLRILPSIEQGDYRYGEYELVYDAIAQLMGSDVKFADWWAEDQAEVKAQTFDELPVLTAALDYVVQNGPWKGTAGRLLEKLNRREYVVGTMRHHDKDWPRKGMDLTNLLRVHIKTLPSLGLDIEKGKRSKHGVEWLIKANENAPPIGDIRSDSDEDEAEVDTDEASVRTTLEFDI